MTRSRIRHLAQIIAGDPVLLSAVGETDHVRDDTGAPPRNLYGTVSFMREQATRTAVGAAHSRFAAVFGCPADAGRSAKREAAICEAVLELINETSYESVTMDAVAARARASKATIYRRWSNKEDLLVDALRRVFAGRDDVAPNTGSLRGDLLAVCALQTDDPVMVMTNIAAVRALSYAAAAQPRVATVIRATLEDAQLQSWQLLLSRAHTRGDISTPVPAALVWEVAQAQFCARTGVQTGPIDAAYIERVIDDILMPVIAHAGRTRETASAVPQPLPPSPVPRADTRMIQQSTGP